MAYWFISFFKLSEFRLFEKLIIPQALFYVGAKSFIKFLIEFMGAIGDY